MTAEAVHCTYDDHPAIAVCSRCGEDVCAHCHGANLAGFCICRTCRREVEGELRTPWEMARTPKEQFEAFLPTVGAVLRRPNSFFFRTLPVGSVFAAATFGFICMTVGIFTRRVFSWLFIDGYTERFSEVAAEVGFSAREFFLLNLGASPFTAIFGLTLHTVIFHLLARAMGGKAPWQISARVTSFSAAALMLQLVPPIYSLDIGNILALLWLVFLESHALRAYHRLSFWRATAVVFAAMTVMLPFMG